MNEQTKDLTILELTAKNFTNLKAVKITPDKNVVVLTGKNEAGKSNVLDAIQSMIEGLKVKRPIKEGEERADATIDLGDIKIRKRWTAKGEILEVFKIVEGKKQTYSSPQTFLNELTGKMIDPMRLYSLMKNEPKKFRDTLASIVGLDLSDLYEEEKSIRDERKIVNDKIRDSIAQLREMKAPDPDCPTEELTFKDQLEKLNKLREKKELFDETKRLIKQNANFINDRKQCIESWEDQIRKLQTEINNANQQIKEAEERKFPDVDEVTQEDITAATSEIERIEELNVNIRQAIRYNKKVKDAQKYQAESDAFSEKLSRIEQDKSTRIANCTFPVEGLSLTDESVLYEGKPIEIASSGRQIRIFTKMAMALSPHIKVLIIRDGSLLDTQGFQEICEIAKEEGYQIWLEKVDETGKVGVYIENGEIKSVDGDPVEQSELEVEDESEVMSQ